MPEQVTHPDGSVCPEGSQKVPEGYIPCCTAFEGHTKACYYDIRYEWWPKPNWMIVIAPSAGGGGILMSFCPHCGTNLSR